MVAGLVVKPFRSLPEDIWALLESSRSEGHNLVERLVDDWRVGSNRFDRRGELACEARLGSKLVAVGGLNQDPYLDDPDVGRIRHVYVVPEARGQGVGRAIVTSLVDHARDHFTRVRLRTTGPGSSEFYLQIGFEEVPDEEGSTHQIELLQGPSPPYSRR
ncbi:MAG TPA: GNAT family N-acetyltransferase [Acidimicrobiia bacterium]|nr:GNAT family N-acetyltransferase [Acidimicrobiia bacterium]